MNLFHLAKMPEDNGSLIARFGEAALIKRPEGYYVLAAAKPTNGSASLCMKRWSVTISRGRVLADFCGAGGGFS